MIGGPIKLRRLFRVVNGGTPGPGAENWDGDLTWVTPYDLGKSNGIRITGSARTLTEQGLRAAANLVPRGSIVLSTRAPIGHIGIADCPLAFNQGCKGLVPREELDERFFYYQLVAKRPELQVAGQGATFAELSATSLGSIRVACPPLDEQRRIANLLEKEAVRLEGLVHRKQRLLALLDDRRAAVARAAVSGELGADGHSRRASGLTWLPTVPFHWRTAKLSLVAKLGTGHTPDRSKAEYWETERDIPWLTTSDIERFRNDRCEVLTETKESISRLGLENSSAVLHHAGTAALSRTASVGFSIIMGREMATSQDFVTWTCSPLLEPRFLLLCLRAMREDLVDRLAMGSTHKTIYMADLQGLRIPLPPIDEQTRAVEVAHGQIQKLDEASALVHQQLPLLSERRNALITEAITGQLDPTSNRASALTT